VKQISCTFLGGKKSTKRTAPRDLAFGYPRANGFSGAGDYVGATFRSPKTGRASLSVTFCWIVNFLWWMPRATACPWCAGHERNIDNPFNGCPCHPPGKNNGFAEKKEGQKKIMPGTW